MSGLIRLALLLLLSFGAVAGTRDGASSGPDDLPAVALAFSSSADELPVGQRLVFAGGHEQRQWADMQFRLPPVADQRWVLWMARDPLDGVRLIDAGGATRLRGFFHPSAEEGLLPVGYSFVLPRDASGPQQLHLEVRTAIRSAPAPRVLSEQDVLRLSGREIALACALYAALVTLLLASLVLYPAVRDRLFLLYSGYVSAALLYTATVNGHAYAWPGLRMLGEFGVRGFWLVILAFNAMALLTVSRFAESRASRSSWVRRVDWLVLGLAGLALAPLIPGAGIGNLLQAIAIGSGVVGILAAILVTLDAARRGVQMAFAACIALVLLLLAAGANEAMHRAWLDDTMLTRHGDQLALALLSVIMFVGLSSRIGLVRQRLDAETSARQVSELGLRQERARVALAQALQDRLRGVPEDEIATIALRLLCQHARDMTGAGAAVVVGQGYLGHELLLVQPAGQLPGIAQDILLARGVVRVHALNRAPVQVRLEAGESGEGRGSQRQAVIPLQLPAPAWAALVLPAPSPSGFDDASLATLLELARLAVQHAEEAHAAIQLRRTAEHDSLTGTQNRRSLDMALARAFKPGRSSDEALAVLFIDIDWFKRINDGRGHACGDLCIRTVAARLRAELRPGDALGRYGGDEFLVLLPGRDAAAARLVAERLRAVVEANPVQWQGESLGLTVSIGLSARRPADREAATLLDRADKALYAAKHEGRNRVCVAPAVFA